MIAEQTVASAEQNLSSSIELFNQGDFAKSEQQATNAIESRGLPVDLYAKALLVRAASRGAASKNDEALADLQEASLGAPDMDQVHAMRSLILKQKGDSTGAAEEAATAKKFNASFKIPQELKKWVFTP
jgi:tetratricopeptide (TPR) repeat protein